MANPAREPDKNCQGVLVAIANASNPTYTEGHQVPLSVDNNGNLRTTASFTGELTIPDAATATNQSSMITHLSAIETAAELIDDAAATIGTTKVLRVALYDNANNQITSFGGAGGTAAADDADFTAGTTQGTPVQGVYESTPTSVTDGDLGTVGITQGRRLKTSATIDAALPAGNNNIGDVDVASCALPTGAATSAKQDTQITHLDAIETAVELIDNAAATIGATNVLRVAIFDNANNQVTSFGGAGGTSAADDADFTAGTTLGTPAMGIYESTPTSVTDGDLGTIGITQGRRLKTSSTIDAALPAGTNNIGDVDIASIAAGDNNIGNVDIASIAAGDNNIGNVDLASAIPAGTNTIGGVIVKPTTSGGFDIFRSIDLDETEEEVKATAGQVYKVIFTNTATSTRWLKFYNATAANVTVGTTTPVLTIGLPGNANDDISGVLDLGGDIGVPFSTAITVAATTGVADNDTGAPGANEVIVNVLYD